jgi:NADH:ubiquinone oxidoreductase subunit 2 (subunit N)
MIKTVHSYWAYLVVLLLVIAVVNAIIGLSQNKKFTDKDLRISLFTLIVIHIQLILGFIVYYVSPYYESMREMGMGATMKDAGVRLYIIEHPLMMILAIILITMGFSKHKKQTTDKGKFKTLTIFYGLGLLFVLSRIPWSQWFGE